MPFAGVFESFASVTKTRASGLNRPEAILFMKHRIPNWPTLLNDGGWREQHVEGEYWPRYFRRRKGQVQYIRHTVEPAGWVLEVSSRYVTRGGLSACLYFAESL